MARQGERGQEHSTTPATVAMLQRGPDNIFARAEQEHIQFCHDRHVRHFGRGHTRERLCSNCRHGYPGSTCPTWARGTA